MSARGPQDPRWPKLLSLTTHEFRTPMTVVSGYIRMLLKERAGPVPDAQRRLLEEAEKSCARLSALLAEVGELSALEGGTAGLSREPSDCRTLLAEAIGTLPEMPDRTITIDLVTESGPAPIAADATRLRTAFRSVVSALRRELVTSDRLLVREQVRMQKGQPYHWIAIGEEVRVESLASAQEADLATFDEWRGGCGLSLPIARRIINAHDGALWSPSEEGKAAAVVALPAQS